jgi:uncharacterized membrane protein (DUF4010 family)
MPTHPLLLAIVVSAGLGALIGLIRQWSEQTRAAKDDTFAGVRTFTFWSVIGCVAAYISDEHSSAVFPISVGVVSLHFVVQMLARKENDPVPGSTTFAATLVTLFVGALVQWNHSQEAILICATSVMLLGMKNTIHAWTRAFTPTDIRATLQFVAITGVILPLVPNETFGPYGAFNPYATWMMVVLISGLGFFGYLMMRMLDARAGLLLTALFGGLASSTAMTLAFSRQSKQHPELSLNYTMGVAIACTVMLPRTLITVGVINYELAILLIGPFVLMALPATLYTAAVWLVSRRRAQDNASTSVENPLSLKTSITFALLYAGIGFLVKAAANYDLLANAMLPLSFISGLTDMAAISLSLAQNQADGVVPFALAAHAIMLAAISNSLLKAGLAASIGSKTLRWHIALILGLTALAGVAGMMWISSSAPDALSAHA